MLGGAALFDNSAAAVYKILCPKEPEFYTPLALNCQKGQHLPALEVYRNQSPIFGDGFKSFIPATEPLDPRRGFEGFLKGSLKGF